MKCWPLIPWYSFVYIKIVYILASYFWILITVGLGLEEKRKRERFVQDVTTMDLLDTTVLLESRDVTVFPEFPELWEREDPMDSLEPPDFLDSTETPECLDTRV